MRNKLFLIFALAAIALPAYAQESDSIPSPAGRRKATVDVRLEVRASYGRSYAGNAALKDKCGFSGDCIDLYLEGSFAEDFSWKVHNRMANLRSGVRFFDGFDDVWLKWQRKGWQITAGKQVVGLGGWEYYAAPIDVYDYSETIGQWLPFQFGISAGYTLREKDTFLIQFCQSPAHSLTGLSDTYGYSAYWFGRHGVYTSSWSVNFFEQQKGQFLNWIALGNRFTINGFNLDIDLYHKMGVGDGSRPFDSFGVVGEASYICAKEHLRVFVKGSYNRNESTSADILVLPGTEMTQLCGGVEYFPIKGTRDLRIHAYYSYAFGNANHSPAAMHLNKESSFNLGITWKASLIDLVRKMYRNE